MSLKRDVSVVSEQRNSCCRPKFTHVFKDVGEGTYIIQMRLRLTGEAISENSFLLRSPNLHPHLLHNNLVIQNQNLPNNHLDVQNQNQHQG